MDQPFTESFIKHIQNMEGDRGKMAVLRKGLIENQAQATWPLLSRFMNFDNPFQIKALQTVAGLFGHHPRNTDQGNFGSLCNQLLDTDEKQKLLQGEAGPVSRHFQHALAANEGEIFRRVQRLILRAKRDEISVNYLQFADDMLGWQRPYFKEKIKLAWGREFWRE